MLSGLARKRNRPKTRYSERAPAIFPISLGLSAGFHPFVSDGHRRPRRNFPGKPSARGKAFVFQQYYFNFAIGDGSFHYITACDMTVKYYNSKVDWWVYATAALTLACCMLGPILSGEDQLLGIIQSIILVGLEIFIFTSIKYAIRGNELGVRMFYKWQWVPIDKITEIKKVTSLLSTAALSMHRVSIKFSDRKILKSVSPMEISPKDRDGFIDDLRTINPKIILK